MNPKMVAQARTARLVNEATTPIYTTSTPTRPLFREHRMAVEWDSVHGRAWNVDIAQDEVNDFIDEHESDVYALSDVDHWTGCWCGGKVNIWE